MVGIYDREFLSPWFFYDRQATTFIIRSNPVQGRPVPESGRGSGVMKWAQWEGGLILSQVLLLLSHVIISKLTYLFNSLYFNSEMKIYMHISLTTFNVHALLHMNNLCTKGKSTHRPLLPYLRMSLLLIMATSALSIHGELIAGHLGIPKSKRMLKSLI